MEIPNPAIENVHQSSTKQLLFHIYSFYSEVKHSLISLHVAEKTKTDLSFSVHI